MGQQIERDQRCPAAQHLAIVPPLLAQRAILPSPALAQIRIVVSLGHRPFAPSNGVKQTGHLYVLDRPEKAEAELVHKSPPARYRLDAALRRAMVPHVALLQDPRLRQAGCPLIRHLSAPALLSRRIRAKSPAGSPSCTTGSRRPFRASYRPIANHAPSRVASAGILSG